MAHLNVLIAASQEQEKVPQSDTKEKKTDRRGTLLSQ